jgi:hypothetical protein
MSMIENVIFVSLIIFSWWVSFFFFWRKNNQQQKKTKKVTHVGHKLKYKEPRIPGLVYPYRFEWKDIGCGVRSWEPVRLPNFRWSLFKFLFCACKSWNKTRKYVRPSFFAVTFYDYSIFKPVCTKAHFTIIRCHWKHGHQIYSSV